MPGRTLFRIVPALMLLCVFAARAADTSAPSATLTSAPNVNNANAASYATSSYLFTITYSDDTAIDVTTLGNNNILVSGAKGTAILAGFVSASSTVNGTPIVATYQFTPVGGVTNFGNDDAYTISVQPTQVKDTSGNAVPTGKLGNFTITILNITSAPTATPSDAAIGQTVQFVSAASGLGNLTYTWDFGDGIRTTGTPSTNGNTDTTSHVYSVTGTFQVVLTVTDAYGQSVTDTTTVNVATSSSTPPSNSPPSGVPPAGAENPDGDADGDGFTNAVEVALGSDPLNAASTPFSLRANPLAQGRFKVEHLIIDLVFNKASNDQIYMSGTIQRAGKFVFQDAPVIVDIGHVIRGFKLDGNGAAVNSVFSNGQVNSLNDSLTFRRVNNNILFQLRIGNGNFQQQFANEPSPDQNLTLTPTNTRFRNVRATIYFNNATFQTTDRARYLINDSQGKFGR